MPLPPALLGRRSVLRLLALGGVPAALLACSRSRKQPAAPGARFGQVKLALDWVPEPEFGGFYAGREGGAFQRAGMEIEILSGGAGVPVLQMVASGQADFGIVGADEVLNGIARGADIVPVFAAFQTSPQGIMVHAARGAKGIADVLTSGTLALEPGAPYAIFLKKKYGFDRARIVPYDGGVARFLTDKDFAQQCFVTSEPIAARKQGSDPQVFLLADEGYNPYATLVITRRALWNEKPDLVRAFKRACREGWRAYLDDPGAANAVMARLNPTLDVATLTAVSAAQKPFIETAETGRDHLGKMTAERWEKLGKQLVELGILKEAPPPSTYLVALDE
jgi:NitT/TauT family transport system substrate-binding protein